MTNNESHRSGRTKRTNPSKSKKKRANRDAILKAEGFEDISEDEQLANLMKHSRKIS